MVSIIFVVLVCNFVVLLFEFDFCELEVEEDDDVCDGDVVRLGSGEYEIVLEYVRYFWVRSC